MKKTFGVFLFFLILIIILTFPLALKINSHIPGFFSTNETYGVLWGSWALKFLFLHKLPLDVAFIAAYPFGSEIHPVDYRSYVWMVWYNSLSILTNPAFAFNFQILLNLFLSAIFTYLLVFYLTKNRLASILGGISFAFCPYQFVRAWQHLGLTYNEWFPLVLYSAILLKEKSSKKRMAAFLISILLLASFNYCITLLGIIALFTFLCYCVFDSLRLWYLKQNLPLRNYLNYFRNVTVVWLIALSLLSFQLFPTIKNVLQSSSLLPPSGFNFVHRPFMDLFVYSARPLSYLLPPVVHPLFGRFTEGFIGSPYYGISFTEHTLYLGWVPLALAFVAFRKWRKDRKLSAIRYTLYAEENFYIGFFVLLAIVAWIFSQPPWWRIGPVRIYMPSFFMYKVLPMFRAYCRFGIVLMLAASVLAGFGLKIILDKLKNQKAKIVVTLFFCCLVLFEFWNYPPYKVIDLTKYPRVYDWLKAQPGDIVIAEYPLDLTGPNESYKFYQTKHEKKIINATLPGTYANAIAKALEDISSKETAQGLSWLGVKYVLVHSDSYQNNENLKERAEMEGIAKNKGLKLVTQIDEVVVYQVVASAVEPKVK